jgi:hypothetical protein
MDFNIRRAGKEDMNAVLELIQELAVFEEEPEAVEVTADDLKNIGFGENPLFHIFVAEVEEKIEAMALFYYRFSTWKGKTVHLEDLIVREKYRNQGLGSALYKEVMKFAYDQNLKRVEWVVLDWNEGAAGFYRKTGADVFQKWDTVQMDEKSLKNYVKS